MIHSLENELANALFIVDSSYDLGHNLGIVLKCRLTLHDVAKDADDALAHSDASVLRMLLMSAKTSLMAYHNACNERVVVLFNYLRF